MNFRKTSDGAQFEYLTNPCSGLGNDATVVWNSPGYKVKPVSYPDPDRHRLCSVCRPTDQWLESHWEQLTASCGVEQHLGNRKVCRLTFMCSKVHSDSERIHVGKSQCLIKPEKSSMLFFSWHSSSFCRPYTILCAPALSTVYQLPGKPGTL